MDALISTTIGVAIRYFVVTVVILLALNWFFPWDKINAPCVKAYDRSTEKLTI